MKKILGILLVAVVLVLVGVFANNSVVSAEESPNRPQRRQRSAQAQMGENLGDERLNPYADTRVLVEAFLVEITMESLYKSGIGPIGQEPDSTSLENVLEKLKDEDSSKVIGGAKVAVGAGGMGEFKGEKRVYNKQEQNNNFREDSFGTQFRINVFINPDNKINMKYSFGQVGLEKGASEDKPPTSISRQWEGTVVLEDGKPAVVGASQDEEKCVFLIISAKIRNK